MCKCTVTIDIANGPDARHIGAQLFIDIDVTILVRLDSGFVQSKVIGVRDTADRNQQV